MQAAKVSEIIHEYREKVFKVSTPKRKRETIKNVESLVVLSKLDRVRYKTTRLSMRYRISRVRFFEASARHDAYTSTASHHK